MAIQVQIIESGKTAWELLRFKIESVGDKKFEVLPFFPTVKEAYQAFASQQPQILVADLKTNFDFNLDLLEDLINHNNNKTKLVVLLSPDQLQGLQRISEIGVSALVLKPVTSQNIHRALLRIGSLIEQDSKNMVEPAGLFITFKTNRSSLYLNQHDILLIESNRNICTITIHDGSQQVVNENISAIGKRLAVNDLVRIDKSTIIHLSRISFLAADRYNRECRFKLENGTEISKTLSKIAMNRLYKMFAKDSVTNSQSLIK
ncbi:MAG TPA: LytTR family transcriptional regulator DNA-binding domain-containing protein [Niabella sp.]|nr:LytTR family transcriptional regulator DNA-binding domain-containing protein [Niabella sp.]HOZ98020.1 LytTR family transcriptional regulator DNA-binding domain-containing protein [Niabella sp.]HQW14835.1 LytTR family transcriptional regulator DNA-binding domain-containing protein [Niabella sp.]HQX18540.1 LytTR family transcriptional regulator DNA-binding domain-containing protein [Niabella sp.]HQX40760.1 LytTR family transcriptional regulator DNA-binding domain-containing protein [Niabella s